MSYTWIDETTKEIFIGPAWRLNSMDTPVSVCDTDTLPKEREGHTSYPAGPVGVDIAIKQGYRDTRNW